jgi:hypothetical protein
MNAEHANDNAQLLMYFAGFRDTSWEVEYRRWIVEIAIQTAADWRSGLDPATVLHVVTNSIDHDKAKLAIVSEVAQATCSLFNKTFGLRLAIDVTGYESGEVLGSLTMPMSTDDLVAHVEQILETLCGFTPTYAPPADGIGLFEWLSWCVEALRHGPGRLPDGEMEKTLARNYQRTGAVLRNVRAAIDHDKLDALLSRPMDAVLERVLRGF